MFVPNIIFFKHIPIHLRNDFYESTNNILTNTITFLISLNSDCNWFIGDQIVFSETYSFPSILQVCYIIVLTISYLY